MSIASKYRPRFTYNDYLLWEGKWELIEGMPYAMSPAAAPNHQEINLDLGMLFKAALQKDCNRCKVYLPIDWKISEHTVVQPDLLIVRSEIKKKFLDFPPALIVEILSPATAYKDRHEKFELYEQSGVQYYLIVDPQFKKTNIYELKDSKYQLSGMSPSSALFTLSADCQLSVNLNAI